MCPHSFCVPWLFPPQENSAGRHVLSGGGSKGVVERVWALESKRPEFESYVHIFFCVALAMP